MKSRFGCYIGSNFAAALAYATVQVLFAPMAMRKLFLIGEEYTRIFASPFTSQKLHV